MRLVPLTGTEQERQYVAGQIRDMEVHSTTDQMRFFLQNVVIAPAFHGEVADESAMTALWYTSPRGCWPGDSCKRADDKKATIYLCISRNGQEASDWERISPEANDTGGRWEPVTNGDPDNPEILFDDGDVVMEFNEEE